MNGFILFEFDSLTPGMRFLLSWLIHRGGSARIIHVLNDAGGAKSLHGWAKPTLGTVRALVRRGHLEQSGGCLQVGDWAVVDACQFATNPHPVPIMRVRAEVAAYDEATRRHAAEGARTWREFIDAHCNHPYHDGDGPASCPECGAGELTHA